MILLKAGICHNDLDESNIMISAKDKRLIVIDFGRSHFIRGKVGSSSKSIIKGLMKSDCRDIEKFKKYIKNLTSSSWFKCLAFLLIFL